MNKLKLTMEVLALKERISELTSNGIKKEFMDSSDVKRLFNITDSTLQRLRNKNEIPHTHLGGKCYYPIDLINKILMERVHPKFKK